MNIRVIVTESGAAVEVVRVISCRDKRLLSQHIRKELRAIIQRVLDENPKAECDMQEALKHGYWFADIGSEQFTVMVLKPQSSKQLDTAVVKVSVEGGLITDVTSPPEVEVVVHDYDIEGADEDRIERDDDGRECIISRWEGGAA